MLTENYILNFYRFAYSILNFAEQDNIRNMMWQWVDYQICLDVFHDDICRAVAVDTKSKQFYGFW